MIFQSSPHLLLRTEFGDRHLPLASGSCWTFGRSDDNNFVLPDRWISRNHAMLQFMENGEFYLIDLGSRNGTFVNGRRVNIPVKLQSGDSLTLGQTEMEFHCPALRTASEHSAESQDRDTATALLNVRRLISVMVVDIRDFTVLTRQLDEKILSEVIGSWFRHAGEIIRQHGSWVDKYIGDAVMAVWIHHASGVSNEEMLRIFRAVSDLHHATSALNDQYPLPFPLRIGAGINTGYAMVGNTGSGDRPDYTALGDTVNAAFRLESSTKEIGLNVAIGETTYKYAFEIGANQTLFEAHTVHLKGYETPTLTHACSFDALDRFLNWKDPKNQGDTPTIGKTAIDTLFP
ncbi:MAG: adenylate/guanylate cyclase domain-containing protein [Leptolyngbyaceae bacterium]|nr:adenylate/guanylate cyclase domain-containing protein [Leptolyngbyaceae bacterium]